MTGWYDFSNVKSSKMLSFDSVSEAHGLIYLCPSDRNFSFAFAMPKIKPKPVSLCFANGVDLRSGTPLSTDTKFVEV